MHVNIGNQLTVHAEVFGNYPFSDFRWFRNTNMAGNRVAIVILAICVFIVVGECKTKLNPVILGRFLLPLRDVTFIFSFSHSLFYFSIWKGQVSSKPTTLAKSVRCDIELFDPTSESWEFDCRIPVAFKNFRCGVLFSWNAMFNYLELKGDHIFCQIFRTVPSQNNVMIEILLLESQ